MEWMWYACALEYTLRGTAAMMLSCWVMRGSLRCWVDMGDGNDLWPSRRLLSETTRSCFSNTFHSLIVLSVRGRGWEGGTERNQQGATHRW